MYLSSSLTMKTITWTNRTSQEQLVLVLGEKELYPKALTSHRRCYTQRKEQWD